MLIFVTLSLVFVIALLVWSAHSISKQKNELARTLVVNHHKTLQLLMNQAREHAAQLLARSPAEYQAYSYDPAVNQPATYVYDNSDALENADGLNPTEYTEVFDLTPDEIIEKLDREYNE